MTTETTQPSDAGAAPNANGLAPSASDLAAQNGLDPAAAPEKLTDAERARRWQSTATKSQQELKALRDQLGPLETLLKNGLTGDIATQAFHEYTAMADDATIGQALRNYRATGKLTLPTPAPEVQEEYLTDTEKRQQAEIAELRALVQTQTQNMGASAFASHAERVFTDLELSGELAEKVRGQLEAQVNQWASQGDAGKQALSDLQHPRKGRETVELLVTRALGAKGMMELAEQRVRRKSTTRAGMATDGPSQFGTTGYEPAPEAKSILEALKTVRARPELLPPV